MRNNLIALAEMDHDCKNGWDHGCQVCSAAFFARSRQKWQRLQEKWDLVRQNSRHIDSQIVAAVMSPTEEEKQNGKH